MIDSSLSPTALTGRGRILLVDDEEPVLKSYGRILESEGFVVERSAEGKCVLDRLSRQDFDAVICDIALQDTDGIHVLRDSREFDPDLPVVLMTAVGDLTSAVLAIEYGALRYLLKPVEPDALINTAASAVRLRKIARAKRQAFEKFAPKAAATDDGDLMQAFDRALEQLFMVYQPIVSWSLRRVMAYEALVRSHEPTLSRPDQLFMAAEALGRLRDLGRTIRRTVANMMSDSADPVRMFVNLHPSDLEDPDLLSADAPLSKVASNVSLELTERASLEGICDVRARVAALRKLGFNLVVDDLGAGYSGLSTFAQLEPEVVKLDMSLIRGIDADPTKQKLVHTMVTMCRDLGIRVVAEGIETVGERGVLLELGCDLLQGFLLATPATSFVEPNWLA